MNKKDLMKLKLENKNNPVIRNLIGTIIGELDRKTKDPSDAEVMQVIKKIRVANSEVIHTEQIMEENEFLESLMPKMLTKDELVSIASDLSFSSMKDYMTYFKDNYPGQYDGKELSVIIKSILS